MTSGPIDSAGAAARQIDSGAERSAALAAARKRAQAAQLAEAQVARESQSEQFAISSEAIARAIGANTRISIERTAASDIFVYRAIDTNTGEVVREWPPQQFAEFIRDLQPAVTDARFDAEAGAILDQSA
ncbi:MAG: flagellar protein FlaG [Pseudomonadota bacterium]